MPREKLSDEQVHAMLDELRLRNELVSLRTEYSYASIAERYGVSRNYVYYLNHGLARKDLVRERELRGEM